ncbi:Gfo/Idh/MocA family protein [Tautonia sociabilis]|uniref:Gfo/Idh/MocA family oxidoreductase n=1 Tax=Tautonia sociabilis TaxID=2080755 RepID=A0A432MR67_9BACT|nr:Gfo/Idh/MocA family oxidoreductase [Tautonia sociabilis]RUL89749.1 Gfo/Idh/MocA family oxidoreductase [Tautonia sociabilis]
MPSGRTGSGRRRRGTREGRSPRGDDREERTVTTRDRLRVGVVGVGHLGRHHARILSGLEGVELVGVADLRADQARTVAEPLGAAAFADYRELLGRVDAVSVAVPTTSHREVAGAFLSRGIHAMVEKPLAASVLEGRELVELADRAGVVLAVGHVERFNPIWELSRDRCPRPRYIDAERLGVYTFRSTDIGAVLDLMIHDIDLILSLVGSPVVSVSALGTPVFGGHEDLAQARLEFEDGCVADIAASRASYQPSRRMRLWGAEGYASIDFASRQATIVRPSESLRRGEMDLRGVDLSRPDAVRDHLFGTVLRVETLAPEAPADQLTAELTDFVRAIRTGTAPRVPGSEALDALRVAEQILAGLRSYRLDAGTEVPGAPHVRTSGAPATEPRPSLAGPKLWKLRPPGGPPSRSPRA